MCELRSLAELVEGEELTRVLEKVLGGEVVPWRENRDRVRVVFQNKRVFKGAGSIASYATAAHQDGFHFRTRFVTVWVALTDIDLAIGWM